MKFVNQTRTIVISNEYVTEPNKQKEAKNHGQSKLKFKSNSFIFYGCEKTAFKNKRGRVETNDDFSYKGKICFYKKHIIQFINNLKPIYLNNSSDYKNISVKKWSNMLDNFLKNYQKFQDDDLIEENFTTTAFRFHEQALEFDLYKNIIFKVAIPYACKITFYKIEQNNYILIIPTVDFDLLQTSYFEKIKVKKDKKFSQQRKGQNIWRDELLTRDKKCVISELEQECVLEAAHIKPFIQCNDREKFNKNNGILLSATLHKFFDAGLITFSENDGKLLVSDFMINSDKNWILKISSNFKTIKLNCEDDWKQMQKFLKFRNDAIFLR